MKALGDAIRGLHGPGSVFPGGTSAAPQATLAPITLNLNIDGTTLARVMSSIAASSFSGQAPAFDGLDSFVGGDHQHTDK
jgi:hypothetical protein